WPQVQPIGALTPHAKHQVVLVLIGLREFGRVVPSPTVPLRERAGSEVRWPLPIRVAEDADNHFCDDPSYTVFRHFARINEFFNVRDFSADDVFRVIDEDLYLSVGRWEVAADVPVFNVVNCCPHDDLPSCYPAAVSSASRRAMMSLYWASVPKPSAPSAPGVPGSPWSTLGPCGPGSPLSPFAALARPAASMRFSSAAVIGVPPSSPSAHLSGSNAISYLL